MEEREGKRRETEGCTRTRVLSWSGASWVLDAVFCSGFVSDAHACPAVDLRGEADPASKEMEEGKGGVVLLQVHARPFHGRGKPTNRRWMFLIIDTSMEKV